MRVDEFENAVWEVEGIRIAVRAPRGSKGKKYAFKKGNPSKHTVQKWLDGRVSERLGDHEVVVINGAGQIVPGQTLMETVRDSYE